MKIKTAMKNNIKNGQRTANEQFRKGMNQRMADRS